ncbi:Uncharacterized protein TCM_010547 [Theobroma cacao]|uniref:Uncharacterized protein n=1 Tax=Theobroma cacao TaxID=3641 RepID=A0A061E6R3_THECC|nr:Uncharacterized protein TCM_010547 [Theobroma cacao]
MSTGLLTPHHSIFKLQLDYSQLEWVRFYVNKALKLSAFSILRIIVSLTKLHSFKDKKRESKTARSCKVNPEAVKALSTHSTSLRVTFPTK